MAVIQCHSCSSWLSVSALPGGNPTAKNNPRFAASWRMCGRCDTYLCDVCAPPSQPACAKCAGGLLPPNKLTPSAFQRWFGLAPTEQFAHVIEHADAAPAKQQPAMREHEAITLGLLFTLPSDWTREEEDGKPVFAHGESGALLTVTKVWVSGRNVAYSLSEHVATTVKIFSENHPGMRATRPPQAVQLGETAAAVLEFEGVLAKNDPPAHICILCVANTVRESTTGLPIGLARFDIFLSLLAPAFAQREAHFRSLLGNIRLAPLRGRLDANTQQMVVQIDARALAASREEARYRNQGAIANMQSAQKWFGASMMPPVLLPFILGPEGHPFQVLSAAIAVIALFKGARYFKPLLAWLVTLPLMVLPVVNLITPIVWILLLQKKISKA